VLAPLAAGAGPAAETEGEYAAVVQPLVRKYCLTCHATKVRKGGLDLERFASLDQVRADLKPWQQVVEQLEAGEMPPKAKPQPTAAERQRLLAWARGLLDAEARTRSGDPGRVPLRRLSNAEYDYTIRDLTAVDLRPTREFPPDGAAGEGFTNAAEALADVSPTLLDKYLAAAKDVAAHAVLLPDGFRFSPSRTRRDWTDESTARLRRFYARYAPEDGRLPVEPYLAAAVRHRDALLGGRTTPGAVAAREHLNPNYFGVLWRALTDRAPSYPLDAVRARWRTATDRDVPALAGEVAARQAVLWTTARVGSYIRPVGKGYVENLARQVPVDPPAGSAAPAGADRRQLLRGHDDFRRVFPLFLCFPRVVPNDEVVSLKMFHREDGPLAELFLDAGERRRLERLWAEHRFISRQPVAENDYLPLFIGFVTQDQPKEMVAFFEGQRPAFRRRAYALLRDEEAAVPRQLDALLEFAGRAYRRPLQESEKAGLLALYRAIRAKGAGHEEAFRGVLARVLVAPAFLFRIEQAPPGKEPAPVNDWELATRLSYFLWSSTPDEELRRLAAAGRLRDSGVLAGQARRMLRDDRVRALAVEFGTQWIHVRGFDGLRDKNEKLFPTFDAGLRQAIYEESVRFFQDLFQADRPVSAVLDADYTFLNEALAKHYGIPGVTGPEWRRVEGVRKYGRGGVLGLASVLATQAGASRTSPTLRGNWVTETLLGEKLPRPPAGVPRLPEEEGDGGLTVRQQVERHARVPSCAACHVRIDPFGFALEAYDPVGRLRAKDLGGLPVDARARLRDGTEFEGIDGLRTYLRTKKMDVVVRLFCRRLLGYALGRSVTLSDQPLIDEMVAELDRNEGRLSAAVQAVVRSPQFRMVRGSDYPE
jgi:mono/diheme cytochrome c family protein